MTRFGIISAAALTVFLAGCALILRSQTTAPRQAGLAIVLSLPQPEVIRGTSIPFTITLTNHGKLPVEVPDASPANRAFRVRVTGKNGFESEGDTASIRIREGEYIEEPRAISRKKIAAGEKLVVTGDLISWIGELAPGSYSVAAQFLNGNEGILSSRPAGIRISEASIVYSGRPSKAPFLAHAPFDTAWIQSGPAGADVYLLQSSPNAPDLAYSNRMAAHIPETVEPRSALNCNATQASRHVAWILGNTFQAVLVTPGIPPPVPATVRLPAGKMEIVGLPFTSATGSLFAMLASREADAVLMMELRADGKPVFTPFEGIQPLRAPRGVLWGRDDSVTIAWTGLDGSSVFAAGMPLAPGSWKMEPARILTGSFPVIDITLAQRPRTSGQGWDRLAVVLSRSSSGREFYRRRIEIATRKVESEERFSADPAVPAALLECALAGDLTPRYLFAGTDGNARFVSADFSRIVPLVARSGKPVRAADFPAILIPSELSAKRGIYVRYIEDGNRFACLKVE